MLTFLLSVFDANKKHLPLRVLYPLARLFVVVSRITLEATRVIVDAGPKILFVKHTYGRGDWMLPGGTVAPVEAALEGARRELREETGVDPEEKFKYHGVVRRRDFMERSDTHIFSVQLDDIPDTLLEAAEIAESVWLTPAMILDQSSGVSSDHLKILKDYLDTKSKNQTLTFNPELQHPSTQQTLYTTLDS